MTPLLRTLKLLTLLAPLALLTGCPGVDDDDLFTGSIQVTNTGSDTVNEIYISNACGVDGWGSARTVTLAPSESVTYDGFYEDTWDVKAWCASTTGGGDGASATITVSVSVGGVANVDVNCDYFGKPLAC